MRVIISTPSRMEAELNTDTDQLAEARPIRRSKKQQSLPVYPFTVISAQGTLLDSGVITVNQRTGKLSVDHNGTEELPLDADRS